MKEIIYKNLTSRDNKTKVISATEIARKNNFLVETTRQTKYLIRDFLSLSAERNISTKKPEIYIRREINDANKKFNWKIKGRILAKYNGKIYPIDYEHTFNTEIVILKKQRKEQKNEKEK